MRRPTGIFWMAAGVVKVKHRLLPDLAINPDYSRESVTLKQKIQCLHNLYPHIYH